MTLLRTTALMIAFAVPTAANAAVINQDLTLTGGFRSTVFLDGFDLYDGDDILTNVELSYSVGADATMNANLCAAFQDCDPGAGSMTVTSDGILAGIIASDTNLSGIDNSTNGNQFGSVNLSIAGTANFANINDFIGLGSVAGGLTFESGYSGYATNFAGNYSGTVTLTYTTSPAVVPLPAALPLMLAGLAGLGVVARRRKG